MRHSSVTSFWFSERSGRSVIPFRIDEDGEVILENLATLDRVVYNGSYESFFDGTYTPLTIIDTSEIESVGIMYSDNLEGRVRTDIRNGLLAICDGKMVLFSKTRISTSPIRTWMQNILDFDTRLGNYMYLNIGKYNKIFPTDIPGQLLGEKNKLHQYWFSYTLTE